MGTDGRLVGREPELNTLAELIEDAGAGRGRVALITGEAGIGKTSLAEAVDAMARALGFDSAWGRCSSSETPSYWPWTQVLNSLLGSAELLEPGRFASRPELFSAVAEAIEARTRVRAGLVIFEDEHWADPGSLGLLEFVAGIVAGQRLLLLITSRDDDGMLFGTAGVRRIPLSGLDLEATGALVRRIVAAGTSREYVAEVYRRSGGNPFFATEVARLQASRGTPTGVVPVGVRQLLEYRLARLPQESVDLLRVASVVGAPDVGRLASVTGLAEAEVAALLDEPAAAGVVVAGAFAHELMRETLYLGMSPDRRAWLHRKVAEQLQAEGPAELARHWSLASGADARPRAARLAVVAGDLAAAGLAYEHAVNHYRLALELGVGDLSVRRRLGEAQVMAGQIGAGRDLLRKAATEARDAGAGEELARAVLALGGGVGGFEVDLLDVAQTRLLEDALRLLPAHDSALRAAVLARLSIVGTGTASADGRAGLANEAAAMARRVGDPEAEVAALAAFCDARSGPDFVEARIDAADRMLTLAKGRALLELLARRIRLRARLEVGDLVGVDADIVGYARIADRLRSPTYSWLVPSWRGMRKALDGDLEAASGYADEVATQAESAQSTNAMMMAWTLRWRVARLRQDLHTMAELPARMAPWAENYPAWSCTFALLYTELGDSELGRRHLRRVMEAGLESIPFDSEWVELLWSLGEAALLLDERATVRTVREALVPYADRWAVDGYGGACFGQVADLLARLGQYLGQATTVQPDRAAFIRTGAVWRLDFRGRTVTVVDSKGMRDLAVLLARPGQEVHVLDLVEVSGGPPRAAAGYDLGPVLDAAARAAYKRRLRDLEDEIETAARNSDVGRLATLQDEREFVAAELAAALGLGGRSRLSGDRVERARKAVAMRIGTALKGIESEHPVLAQHLRNSVSTGRFCRYRPDQDISWLLTAGPDNATPDVAPSR